MGKHTRSADPWKVKLCIGVIRQVRGKALLESLYRLQQGHCAYDEERCALLLPPSPTLIKHLGLERSQMQRFATTDHVVPRAMGGDNSFSNLVMASQVSNAAKGALAPLGQWVPKVRHTNRDVERALMRVEQQRIAEATELALMRKFSKQEVYEYLFRREIRRIKTGRDFKFYDSYREMVA